MRAVDLVGQIFGRLTVIKRVGSNKHKHATWLCECECGAMVIVCGNSLRSGLTKSCGCLQKEKAKNSISVWNKTGGTKHGGCGTRLYREWSNMLTRANVHGSLGKKAEKYYGKVRCCKEWESFEKFKDWALSHGYTDNLQIDRINNDGDYTPENCRWVPAHINANNRRCTRMWKGAPVAEICRCLGMQTYDEVTKNTTKEYKRVYNYYYTHNGDLPPDIKARYETYLKESC